MDLFYLTPEESELFLAMEVQAITADPVNEVENLTSFFATEEEEEEDIEEEEENIEGGNLSVLSQAALTECPCEFEQAGCVFPYIFGIETQNFLVYIPKKGVHRLFSDIDRALEEKEFLALNSRERDILGIFVYIYKCIVLRLGDRAKVPQDIFKTAWSIVSKDLAEDMVSVPFKNERMSCDIEIPLAVFWFFGLFFRINEAGAILKEWPKKDPMRRNVFDNSDQRDIFLGSGFAAWCYMQYKGGNIAMLRGIVKNPIFKGTKLHLSYTRVAMNVEQQSKQRAAQKRKRDSDE